MAAVRTARLRRGQAARRHRSTRVSGRRASVAIARPASAPRPSPRAAPPPRRRRCSPPRRAIVPRASTAAPPMVASWSTRRRPLQCLDSVDGRTRPVGRDRGEADLRARRAQRRPQHVGGARIGGRAERAHRGRRQIRMVVSGVRDQDIGGPVVGRRAQRFERGDAHVHRRVGVGQGGKTRRAPPRNSPSARTA